jgi:hypothetical protein
MPSKITCAVGCAFQPIFLGSALKHLTAAAVNSGPKTSAQARRPLMSVPGSKVSVPAANAVVDRQ